MHCSDMHIVNNVDFLVFNFVVVVVQLIRFGEMLVQCIVEMSSR